MNLENVTQSERRKSQNATHCTIPFIGQVQGTQIYRRAVAQDLGDWGKWGVAADGYEVSLRGEENVPGLTAGDGCTALNILKITGLSTFTEVDCIRCELHLNKTLIENH